MSTEDPTAPSWLLNGDNAWQLTAASLVGLQSIPGLVVLYAGIVKKKWAVNSAFMAWSGFSITLLIFVLYAYEAGFGKQMLPFVGVPNHILSIDRQLRQADIPSAGIQPAYGASTLCYFQFVFCAITVVILSGAVLCRMSFYAWLVFVPLWVTLSYTVGSYSLWGGGFLYQMGVIDYSGGYVIHVSSGTAGFVAAYWVGPRLDIDRRDFRPNNLISVLMGAGILWTGWNGFNGGDPYTASPDAGVAVLNTNICTAMSTMTWTVMDMVFYGKPSVLGAVNGMITGLVAITPAAGVIAGWSAILLGLLSGTIPWVSMNVLGKRTRLFTVWVDDCLGIFHTHAVAGVLGGFCTGLFATWQGSAAFDLTNPGGAIDRNGKQVWLQIVGFLFIMGWNAFWTTAILLFIKHVLRIPLRMDEQTLLIGDDAVHGEEAYSFLDAYPHHAHHDEETGLGAETQTPDEGEGLGENGKEKSS